MRGMESEQPHTAAPAAPVPAPKRPAPKWPLAVAFIAGGTGAVILLVVMTRPSPVAATPGPAPAAPVHAAPVPAAAPASIQPFASAKQLWRATRPPQDVRYGRDVIVFELAAENDVPVWHKRVRPQLAIRCAERVMDLYVMTHTAASFENGSNQHTVHLAFDGAPAITEKWDHSVDHEALFAPESGSLVGEIASAKTMTFAFTPFNAAPTFVHFNVAGLDKHLAAAARTCGLKRR